MTISEQEREMWHTAAANVGRKMTDELVAAFGGEVSPPLLGALARIARNTAPDDIRLLAAEITGLRQART